MIFGCFALLSAVALWLVPSSSSAPQRSDQLGRPAEATGILLLALAFCLGTIVATAAGTFYVSSSSLVDSSPGRAGLLVAAGSVLALVTRVVLGVVADRRSGSPRTGGLLLAIGALAMASIHPAAWFAASALVFVELSGWPGLLLLAVVRVWRTASAPATAKLGTGAYVGGAVGPLMFGAVADHSGFRASWRLMAAIALVVSTRLGFRRCIELTAHPVREVPAT